MRGFIILITLLLYCGFVLSVPAVQTESYAQCNISSYKLPQSVQKNNKYGNVGLEVLCDSGDVHILVGSGFDELVNVKGQYSIFNGSYEHAVSLTSIVPLHLNVHLRDGALSLDQYYKQDEGHKHQMIGVYGSSIVVKDINITNFSTCPQHVCTGQTSLLRLGTDIQDWGTTSKPNRLQATIETVTVIQSNISRVLEVRNAKSVLLQQASVRYSYIGSLFSASHVVTATIDQVQLVDSTHVTRKEQNTNHNLVFLEAHFCSWFTLSQIVVDQCILGNGDSQEVQEDAIPLFIQALIISDEVLVDDFTVTNSVVQGRLFISYIVGDVVLRSLAIHNSSFESPTNAIEFTSCLNATLQDANVSNITWTSGQENSEDVCEFIFDVDSIARQFILFNSVYRILLLNVRLKEATLYGRFVSGVAKDFIDNAEQMLKLVDADEVFSKYTTTGIKKKYQNKKSLDNLVPKLLDYKIYNEHAIKLENVNLSGVDSHCELIHIEHKIARFKRVNIRNINSKLSLINVFGSISKRFYMSGCDIQNVIVGNVRTDVDSSPSPFLLSQQPKGPINLQALKFAKIFDSSFVNCSNSFSGGALVATETAKLKLMGSSFYNNSAGIDAGAVAVHSPVAKRVRPGNRTSLFINRVVLKGNRAARHAGGLHVQFKGVVKLSNSRFVNNSANQLSGKGGGALVSTVCAPSLQNVVFINNTGGHSGGGLYLIDNQQWSQCSEQHYRSRNNTVKHLKNGSYILELSVLSGAVFSGNHAGVGGGMFLSNWYAITNQYRFAKACARKQENATECDSSTFAVLLLLRDALFVNNTAVKNGGGLAVQWGGQDVSVQTCVFVNNQAHRIGGGIALLNRINQRSEVLISDSVLDSNVAQYGAGVGALGEIFTWIRRSHIVRGCAILGGGLYADQSPMVAIGGDETPTYIQSNIAQASGGGALITQASSVLVSNVHTSHNIAPNGAGMSIVNTRNSLSLIVQSVYDQNTAASIRRHSCCVKAITVPSSHAKCMAQNGLFDIFIGVNNGKHFRSIRKRELVQIWVKAWGKGGSKQARETTRKSALDGEDKATPSMGGALKLSNGTVIVHASQFSGNNATYGGAISWLPPTNISSSTAAGQYYQLFSHGGQQRLHTYINEEPTAPVIGHTHNSALKEIVHQSTTMDTMHCGKSVSFECASQFLYNRAQSVNNATGLVLSSLNISDNHVFAQQRINSILPPFEQQVQQVESSVEGISDGVEVYNVGQEVERTVDNRYTCGEHVVQGQGNFMYVALTSYNVEQPPVVDMVQELFANQTTRREDHSKVLDIVDDSLNMSSPHTQQTCATSVYLSPSTKATSNMTCLDSAAHTEGSAVSRVAPSISTSPVSLCWVQKPQCNDQGGDCSTRHEAPFYQERSPRKAFSRPKCAIKQEPVLECDLTPPRITMAASWQRLRAVVAARDMFGQQVHVQLSIQEMDQGIFVDSLADTTEAGIELDFALPAWPSPTPYNLTISLKSEPGVSLNQTHQQLLPLQFQVLVRECVAGERMSYASDEYGNSVGSAPQCFKCQPDYYNLEHRNDSCNPCPPNMVCPGGALLVPSEGQWHTLPAVAPPAPVETSERRQGSDIATRAMSCPNPQACNATDGLVPDRLKEYAALVVQHTVPTQDAKGPGKSVNMCNASSFQQVCSQFSSLPDQCVRDTVLQRDFVDVQSCSLRNFTLLHLQECYRQLELYQVYYKRGLTTCDAKDQNHGNKISEWKQDVQELYNVSLCSQEYQGPLCALCADGTNEFGRVMYGQRGPFVCVRCSGIARELVFIVLGVLILFVTVSIFFTLKINQARWQCSVSTSDYIRVFVVYLQRLAIIIRMHVIILKRDDFGFIAEAAEALVNPLLFSTDCFMRLSGISRVLLSLSVPVLVCLGSYPLAMAILYTIRRNYKRALERRNAALQPPPPPPPPTVDNSGGQASEIGPPSASGDLGRRASEGTQRTPRQSQALLSLKYTQPLGRSTSDSQASLPSALGTRPQLGGGRQKSIASGEVCVPKCNPDWWLLQQLIEGCGMSDVGYKDLHQYTLHYRMDLLAEFGGYWNKVYKLQRMNQKDGAPQTQLLADMYVPGNGSGDAVMRALQARPPPQAPLSERPPPHHPPSKFGQKPAQKPAQSLNMEQIAAGLEITTHQVVVQVDEGVGEQWENGSMAGLSRSASLPESINTESLLRAPAVDLNASWLTGHRGGRGQSIELPRQHSNDTFSFHVRRSIGEGSGAEGREERARGGGVQAGDEGCSSQGMQMQMYGDSTSMQIRDSQQINSDSFLCSQNINMGQRQPLLASVNQKGKMAIDYRQFSDADSVGRQIPCGRSLPVRSFSGSIYKAASHGLPEQLRQTYDRQCNAQKNQASIQQTMSMPQYSHLNNAELQQQFAQAAARFAKPAKSTSQGEPLLQQHQDSYNNRQQSEVEMTTWRRADTEFDDESMRSGSESLQSFSNRGSSASRACQPGAVTHTGQLPSISEQQQLQRVGSNSPAALDLPPGFQLVTSPANAQPRAPAISQQQARDCCSHTQKMEQGKLPEGFVLFQKHPLAAAPQPGPVAESALQMPPSASFLDTVSDVTSDKQRLLQYLNPRAIRYTLNRVVNALPNPVGLYNRFRGLSRRERVPSFALFDPCQPTQQHNWNMPDHRDLSIVLVITILTLFYPSLCYSVLSAFACLRVDHVYPQPRWSIDMSMRCYTGSHRVFAIFAGVLGLPLLVFGIPCLMVLVLFRKRLELGSARVQQRFLWLYHPYRPKWFFWEGWKMFETGAHVAVLVLTRTEAASVRVRGTVLLAISFGANALTLIVRPHRFTSVQSLDVLGGCANVVSLLVAQLALQQVQFEDYQPVSGGMGNYTIRRQAIYVAIMIHVILLLAFILVIVASMRSKVEQGLSLVATVIAAKRRGHPNRFGTPQSNNSSSDNSRIGTAVAVG